MKDKLKKDYLNYLFFRTKKNLNRYHISAEDSELIKNIFSRLINSENIHTGLFILYNIKEFKNLSKYMIFILKKLDDDVINFENLTLNIDNDSEFIQNEILSYLSNPERKIIKEIKYKPVTVSEEEDYNISNKFTGEESLTEEVIKEEEIEEEETEFRKNYLELIQTEEEDTGIVYELPGMETDPDELKDQILSDPEFDLPEEGSLFDEEKPGKINKEEDQDEQIREKEIVEQHIEITDREDKFESEKEENVSGYISEDELYPQQESGIINNQPEQEDEEIEESAFESKSEEKIQLSEEIQEELDLFDEYGEPEDEEINESPVSEDSEKNVSARSEKPDPEEERLIKEINETESEPANTIFVEYESEIREKNRYLEREFQSLINLSSKRDSEADSEKNSTGEEERSKIIFSIIETSQHLETLSRNMSLEVISNIYQTITLSFEKISEAKYDITESTLNLFKKGLTLVISLINGDNYFGYKDILKSIENIRNTLLEEKHKRETYLKRLEEKLEMEKNLDRRFPDDKAKSKISQLKKYIKETEINFNSLDDISGEYQIYEALRSLSGSLNNFKDIVKVSKELRMKKLVQLSEAGYIFVKFLQNYRINPVTDETKEIFGYIIHNLKLLAMDRDAEDVDLFISYLNDPVKIYSKSEKKNKNNINE